MTVELTDKQRELLTDLLLEHRDQVCAAWGNNLHAPGRFERECDRIDILLDKLEYRPVK